MMIVHVISAFIVGCFLGLLILLGIACVIGIAVVAVKIFERIMDFMR